MPLLLPVLSVPVLAVESDTDSQHTVLVTPLDLDFPERWKRWYSDLPPVGFLLRDAVPWRWLRVHSLPASNRYPESSFEYAELLRRHQAVADDILGIGSRCALLLLTPCGTSPANNSIGAEGTLTTVLRLDEELSDDESGIFAERMCLVGGQVIWSHGEFDKFIVATAEDKVCGIVVELEHGGVYAPYDGGADLIYPSETRREQAAEQFAEWRSSRADGL